MSGLKWTTLLLILELLTSSTPMRLHDHRPGSLGSMSSESSHSAESAETDPQVLRQVSSAGPQPVGEESHASETAIVRTAADFGRPDENGRGAVTVSLRDENTNVSVDVLTLVFAEDGGSSAAGESSGLGNEGMQADEPAKTQLDTTDQAAMDLQRDMDALSREVQADEAFIAGKASEGTSSNSAAKQTGEGTASSAPVYSAEHGSDNHPTQEPQSDSTELSAILSSALHSLLGELTGLKPDPIPRSPQSLTSREDATARGAKPKDTDPRPDSKDSQGGSSDSRMFQSVRMFQAASSLNSSSEEDDEDESFGTEETPSQTLGPVPSPEPLAVKETPPKPFSSGPVYVSDGWPAVDYSTSLKDFSPHYVEYEEWDHTDTSINPHYPGTLTDTSHATDSQDLEEGPTENENPPTEVPKREDNSQEEELEMASGSPGSREDGNSSETSRETGFLLPKVPDSSPTNAAFSRSQESTGTLGNEPGATVMSSSSEERTETDSTESLEPVDSNSTETQNQRHSPDPPGKRLVSHVQLGKPVDLTPGSSSEEELDPVPSTEAPGGTSTHAPMSSEEQVSPGNVDRRSHILSTSEEEDANGSLGPDSPPSATSGISSSEDKQREESFSNESPTDSPAEATPESTLSLESLEVTTGHPAVHSESVSIRDFLVSDEDISTHSPSTSLANGAGLAAVDANANDANKSEESLESQDLTSSTAPPGPSHPSQAPHTEQSSEEDNIRDRKSDRLMTTHIHSNPAPTATRQEAAANPWTAFLQALRAHVAKSIVQHADHKGQRSYSSYGSRHLNRHHHGNRGKKASSSEESK